MKFYMEIFSNNNRKLKGILLVIIILAGAFWGGFYFGTQNQNLASGQGLLAYSREAREKALGNNPHGEQINFDLYWEVWNKLKSNYVDTNRLSDQDLFYGSLRGLAAATEDPYTVFMDPEEAKEFADDLTGSFEGIGAEIGFRHDIPTVISPLDGMPAQKAGLMPGDKIYAVNSEPTIGLSLNAIVRKIRGPKDTDVVLTIIRGQESPQDITITRSVIVTKSVKSEMRSDGLFLIKISSFNADTENLFNEAIKEILLENPRGIILDLRNNPGGYLETAVTLASEWVEEGPLVAEQFNNNRRSEYPAHGRARLANFPTVVLVNAGSASASEILAGALRDYKKATIIGEKTYGKGSVQSLSDLKGGATLKITVAKWLTPAGDYINDSGLEPNMIVEMNMDDVNNNRDPQLDKAVELLLEKNNR